MKFDIKKTCPSPNNDWDAIKFMTEAQLKLIDALHIMSSVLENNTDEFKESHEKRIKDFIKQFEKK